MQDEFVDAVEYLSHWLEQFKRPESDYPDSELQTNAKTQPDVNKAINDFKVLSSEHKQDSTVSFLVMILVDKGWVPYRAVLRYEFKQPLLQGWKVIHFDQERITHPIMDI